MLRVQRSYKKRSLQPRWRVCADRGSPGRDHFFIAWHRAHAEPTRARSPPWRPAAGFARRAEPHRTRQTGAAPRPAQLCRKEKLISFHCRLGALLTATERIINCNSEMDALLMPLQSDGAIGTALQGSPNSGKRTNLAFAKSSKGSGLVRAGTEPAPRYRSQDRSKQQRWKYGAIADIATGFRTNELRPSGCKYLGGGAQPPRRNSDVGSGGLFGAYPVDLSLAGQDYIFRELGGHKGRPLQLRHGVLPACSFCIAFSLVGFPRELF